MTTEAGSHKKLKETKNNIFPKGSDEAQPYLYLDFDFTILTPVVWPAGL